VQAQFDYTTNNGAITITGYTGPGGAVVIPGTINGLSVTRIGRIEGGDWASSVPSWCRLDCRIAIYPGTPAQEAAREIEKAVADFARSDKLLANNPPRVVFNGFTAEGYVLEPGSEAEAVLARSHQAATGKKLESFMSAAYLDARVYALYDKVPTLCYGPTARGIHGVDECVSLPSVRRITVAMTLFIAEWCGVEPLPG